MALLLSSLSHNSVLASLHSTAAAHHSNTALFCHLFYTTLLGDFKDSGLRSASSRHCQFQHLQICRSESRIHKTSMPRWRHALPVAQSGKKHTQSVWLMSVRVMITLAGGRMTALCWSRVFKAFAIVFQRLHCVMFFHAMISVPLSMSINVNASCLKAQ